MPTLSVTQRKCETLEDQEAAESSPDAAPRHDDTGDDDDDDEFTPGIQSQHFNISLMDVTI